MTMALTERDLLNSDQHEQLAITREALSTARHLPGWMYTSEEIYALEIERIFMKSWLCVGRVEEYENPGDYHAMRIAGEPVLICRNQNGKLNAFNNVCKHRGVEVAQGQGNINEFTCPYHGWLYGLDGKLIGAPLSAEVEGYDFKQCRLPKIQIDTWGGYVFVNFDPECPSLADYLDEDKVRDFAAFLQPESTRTSDKYVFELPCNWKFVPENLMDMYHVGVIHGSSFGAHFPVNNFKYNLSEHGFNAKYESFTMAPEGVTLFGTMPWLKGKVDEFFACSTWIRPTMNIFGRHDLIQPWVALPMGPNRTQITIYTQLPTEYFDTPGFKEKNQVYADFIRLVAEEDRGMMESLHNAANSRAFTPGPTVKLERAIHHLLNFWLDTLFEENPEAAAVRRADGAKALAQQSDNAAAAS
jgi:Rieske 2Fe-2S family protein